jgi:hypothetical protein
VGEHRGEYRVLYIMEREPLQRSRDQMRPQKRKALAAVPQADHVAVYLFLQHDCHSTLPYVHIDKGVRRVHGHVAQTVCAAMIGRLQAQGVIGVEDGYILRHFDDDALDLRHLLHGFDPTQAQVIGAHVETGRYAALGIPQTPPQPKVAEIVTAMT